MLTFLIFNIKKMEDLKKVCEISDITEKGFYVYKGLSKEGNNKLKYIGTTIQVPSERFRWHKYNGKDLLFELIAICQTSTEMLDLEYRLIKKYNPPMNKIKSRRQNFNVILSDEEIESRKGNKEWCQCCLKRHVNKGYSRCYYCSH